MPRTVSSRKTELSCCRPPLQHPAPSTQHPAGPQSVIFRLHLTTPIPKASGPSLPWSRITFRSKSPPFVRVDPVTQGQEAGPGARGPPRAPRMERPAVRAGGRAARGGRAGRRRGPAAVAQVCPWPCPAGPRPPLPRPRPTANFSNFPFRGLGRAANEPAHNAFPGRTKGAARAPRPLPLQLSFSFESKTHSSATEGSGCAMPEGKRPRFRRAPRRPGPPVKRSAEAGSPGDPRRPAKPRWGGTGGDSPDL